jgi:hypothetical protein
MGQKGRSKVDRSFFTALPISILLHVIVIGGLVTWYVLTPEAHRAPTVGGKDYANGAASTGSSVGPYEDFPFPLVHLTGPHPGDLGSPDVSEEFPSQLSAWSVAMYALPEFVRADPAIEFWFGATPSGENLATPKRVTR